VVDVNKIQYIKEHNYNTNNEECKTGLTACNGDIEKTKQIKNLPIDNVMANE
jgi:hypothetical protein